MAIGDYGVTAAGFVIKPTDVIQTEIEESFQASWGDDIDLSPQSDLGQAAGLATKLVHEGGWQAAQDAYSAADPDAATGIALDKVARLTGTLRDAATKTTVFAILSGTPGTVIPATAAASVDTTHERFDIWIGGQTLGTASAWTATSLRVITAKATVAGTILEVIVHGTTGASAPTPPATLGGTVVDGTVTWRRVGTGTGYLLAEFRATTAGATVLTAGHLTRIETPTAGWLTVYNSEDALVQGAAVESDSSLRLRRYAELHAQGRRTLLSIQDTLSRVTDVTDAFVLENTSLVTDGYGIPAHAIAAIVLGGTDAAVALALFNVKGEGTETYGTTSETITDSKDIEHVIKFSRPTDHDIYVVVNIAVTSAFPSTGDAAIETALTDYGAANYVPGSSVVASKLDRQCWITGVTDVECLIGLTGTPAPTLRTTITSTVLQIPRLDTGRITVNHV